MVEIQEVIVGFLLPPDVTPQVGIDRALDDEGPALLEEGAQLSGQQFVGNSVVEWPGAIWLLYAGLEGRVPEVRF